MAEGGDGDDQIQHFRDGRSQHNSPASSVTSINSLNTRAEPTHDLQANNLETSDSTVRPDQRISTGPEFPPLWEQQQQLSVSNRLQPASNGPTHQVTLQDFGPVSVAHPSFVTSIRASRQRGSLQIPARASAVQEGSRRRASAPARISASEGSLAAHRNSDSADSAEQASVQPMKTLRQRRNSSRPVVGNVTEIETSRTTASSEDAQILEDVVGRTEESRAQVEVSQAAASSATPAAPISDASVMDTHAADALATDVQVPDAPAPDVPDPPNVPSESPSENAAILLSKGSMISVEFSSTNVPDGSTSPVEVDSGQDTGQSVSQQSVSQQSVSQQSVSQQSVSQQTVSQQTVSQQSVSQQSVSQQSVSQQTVSQQPVSQQSVSQQPTSQGSGASAATVSKTLAVTSAVQQLAIKSDASQAKRSPSPLQDALAASMGAAQRQEVPVLQTVVTFSPPETQHTAQPATTTEDPTNGEIASQQTLMRQISGGDGAGAVSLRRSNSRAEPGDQAAALPEAASSSHDSDS